MWRIVGISVLLFFLIWDEVAPQLDRNAMILAVSSVCIGKHLLGERGPQPEDRNGAKKLRETEAGEQLGQCLFSDIIARLMNRNITGRVI
ncbi:unnamed protein product [Heligmosomoides polygyrus]|uniref:Secreted protein n=1 Tax=Heligmosomoides polygyrus TaxID=6339 RepID=A0A183FVU9_HELPZ|nr:unnamed protein product [Heligmosomoides polygyrus]